MEGIKEKLGICSNHIVWNYQTVKTQNHRVVEETTKKMQTQIEKKSEKVYGTKMKEEMGL